MKTPIGPFNPQPWQINAVVNSMWFPIDEDTAIKALQDSRGNLDDAVSKLMDDNTSPNNTPSVYSSSVEPQLDPSIKTDENSTDAPNKKQDRRLSRASKSASRTRERRYRDQLLEKLSSSSLEQLEQASGSSLGTSGVRRRYNPVIPDDEDTEMDDSTPPPHLLDGSTSSESDYSTNNSSPPKPPLTLKLSLKPPQPSTSAIANPGLVQSISKPIIKDTKPNKRLTSARDMKSLKKQAQKQAAKERRQAASKPAKEQSTLSFTSTGSSQSSVNNGFRLLHV